MTDISSLVLTIVLFLAGIPVAYFFGRRSRQVPDLRSAVDFDQIVRPGDWLVRGDLDIQFDGRDLERVSRTYLAFWNHRGDTVRGKTILESDPLRVMVDDGDEIFQTRVVCVSRPQIGATTGREGSITKIDFEFLDRRDGFVIEVLHQGASAARIEGTIPGTSLRSPRNVILNAHARRAMRAPYFKRHFIFLSKPMFVWATSFLVMLGLVATASGIKVLRRLNPELVDVDLHDLESIEGQHEFSKEVSKIGGESIANQIIDSATVALFFLALTLFARMPRVVVPRSVIRNDIDDAAESMTSKL